VDFGCFELNGLQHSRPSLWNHVETECFRIYKFVYNRNRGRSKGDDDRRWFSAMSTGVTYQYLEPRPRSAYRQLFIKNTRIRAELIYRAHINADEPMTADELAADYGLPLAAVVEAIEYGRSNSPEIASDMAREQAIMAATGQLDPGYKYHPHPKRLAPEEWARLRS
jgi:uncharacterized protein (DUF433 family)